MSPSPETYQNSDPEIDWERVGAYLDERVDKDGLNYSQAWKLAEVELGVKEPDDDLSAAALTADARERERALAGIPRPRTSREETWDVAHAAALAAIDSRLADTSLDATDKLDLQRRRSDIVKIYESRFGK